MTFGPRNAYYLRISTNVVLPLLLYLDERHVDWMSDVVLQHVLADLRPLIIPKLQAEKDVHFGPGTTPGNKRGTVEVHRGQTYQFAYFFRKIEPHIVLFKSRCFVTVAPPPAPKSASLQFADGNLPTERLKTRVSAKKSKRKRVKSKGKGKSSQSHFDESGWSAGESEEGMGSPDPILRELRPVRKQRRILTGTCQQDDGSVEDVHEEVATNILPSETGGESSATPDIPTVNNRDAAAYGSNDRQPDMSDIELVIEEEEPKPKPILKLKYQSFPISGHCLSVVVEPWPPLRAETNRPLGLGSQFVRRILEPSLGISDGSVIAGQRARTPLFLPEVDRAPSEVSFPGEKLPPVLFDDKLSALEEEESLMHFSQTLNAAGHRHAIAADDDDDMDGAVLFGDADEIRELF